MAEALRGACLFAVESIKRRVEATTTVHVSQLACSLTRTYMGSERAAAWKDNKCTI